MANQQSTAARALAQGAKSRVAAILDSIDASRVLRRLNQYRLGGGPRTYRLESFWRAYVIGYLLNIQCTTDLYRRLEYDPAMRQLCGFSTALPHRTTFGRFFARLTEHTDLVTECVGPFVEAFREIYSDLGEKVAVDSSAVRSHSNGNRNKGESDPDAGWAIKNSARSKSGKEDTWGFKLHLAVDAQHDVPLAFYVTKGSDSDFPELPTMLDVAQDNHEWVQPRYVMADRGYDSLANHRDVMRRGGDLIAPMRRKPRPKGKDKGTGLYADIFSFEGVPMCVGGNAMEYVETDPELGHLYRCPEGGCELKDRKGVIHCDYETWVSTKAEDNPRLHGRVRRDSKEWKELYDLRQSVERVFKSLKQSRRLEGHCYRGLNKVALHATMSVLTFTATLLVQTLAGVANPRWMVQKVA